MGRRDNIIAFQRPVSARKGPRLPWERRFHISRRLRQFGILSAALLAIPVALLQVEKPFAERPTIASVSDISGTRVTVSWVDGDSGRINGREFRLHGVDAPEGSPSRARCERERRRAVDAEYAVRTLTAGKRAVVRRSHGVDKYGRELIDLSVDGQDVAARLLAQGHLKQWNYDAGAAKPDWCG